MWSATTSFAPGRRKLPHDASGDTTKGPAVTAAKARFIFRPQGRQSKQTGSYFPSAMDAKEDCMDAILRPCGRKSIYTQHYFPSAASMQSSFASVTDAKEDCMDAVFRP